MRLNTPAMNDEISTRDALQVEEATLGTAVIATSHGKLLTEDDDRSPVVCSMDPLGTVAEDEPAGASSERELVRLNVTTRRIHRLLSLLVAVVVIWFLSFAQAVMIPLALSIVLYLLLRPAVRWMYRRRIPEAVGATLCLFVVALTLVIGIFPLVGPAQSWMEKLPDHLKQAERKLSVIREHIGQFSQIRARLANLGSSENGEKPIPVEFHELDLAGSASVITMTGSTLGLLLIVIVLTYFLLVSGDQLINHFLSILPTFREKRQTVELILDVQRGISSYLFTITIINIGLGVAIGCALWVLGVPNPAMWGLLTTLFNYVPFVGQGVIGLIISLVALLAFDSVGYALLVPITFYTIAAIEGNVITPALVGKHLSLNPIIVLVSLLFWGWMWGIAGAALAVPILAMVKIGCDRFECTRSVGTLLGG